MQYRDNFSNTLRQMRKSRNLSLATLGEIVGVSNQAISLLEQGKRSPSFEVLCTLADYFDVSLDYITGRNDNPNSHKL